MSNKSGFKFNIQLDELLLPSSYFSFPVEHRLAPWYTACKIDSGSKIRANE